MDIGASVVNGDLVHGPIMRFVPPQNLSLPQRLPPYGWVARLSVLAMKYMPKALLRPLLMSFITTALGPERSLFQQNAILVNAEGQRFTDELATPALEVPKQPNGVAYIILDKKIAQQFTAVAALHLDRAERVLRVPSRLQAQPQGRLQHRRDRGRPRPRARHAGRRA